MKANTYQTIKNIQNKNNSDLNLLQGASDLMPSLEGELDFFEVDL